MKKTLQRPELAEELTDKQIHLIRTTYQAISEKGAHRVSLQDIATAAGVSKGILLYHFETKDDLILRTMQWVLSRTETRIREAIASVPAPREQVLAMVDVIYSHPEANRRFYLTYLDLLEHSVRMDTFGNLASTFRGIVNSLYEEVVGAGVKSGVFRVPDAKEASVTVRAIVDGMFLQWLGEKDWKRSHRAYKEACQRAILAYLGAEADEFRDWKGAVAPWT